MDEFLKPGASFNRLKEEWDKYGSLCIGYDFDSTVFDYHKRGESYDMVIELLRDLKSIGCKLICWTATHDHTTAASFLIDNRIPCDGINTDGIDLGWTSRKSFFSALLDDRAGLRHVYDDLSALVHYAKNGVPVLKQ